MTRQRHLKHMGILGVGALFMAHPAWAQTTRTWESAVSDNFAVATRWSPDGKPTGSDVARFNQTGSYTISFTVNESFGELQIQGGAQLTWSSGAARIVNVSNISISGASNPGVRLASDVRVNSAGNTSVGGSAGAFLGVDGGRLTTDTLSVLQGTVFTDNAPSLLTVNGLTSVTGLNATANLSIRNGSTANFNGNVSLAPSGGSGFRQGNFEVITGSVANIASGFNLTIGSVIDDNRQGIVEVNGAGSQLNQAGSGNIIIGYVIAGIPPSGADNSSRIEVSNGGTVTTGTGSTILNSLGHINVLANGTFNANGLMTINSGGELNLTGGVFNRSADLVVNGGKVTQTASNISSTSGAVDLTVQNAGNFITALSLPIPSGGNTTVTGSGSVLQANGGVFSTGGTNTQLNVLAGGVVTGNNLTLGTTGIVTSIVDGANSRITAAGGPSLLAAGVFTVRNNGLVQLADTAVGTLASSATLNIQTGSVITTANLDLAGTNAAGSGATVNISGVNSSLTQTGATGFVLGGTTTGASTMNIGTGGLFSTGTGSSRINAQGIVNVTPGGTFRSNGSLLVDGGRLLTVTGTADLVSGSSLTLQNSAIGTFANLSLNNGTQITVDNSELRLNDLTPQGGSVNFLGGLVNFVQSVTLSGGKLTALLGPTPTLYGGRTLQVAGTATLQSQLTLEGGVLSVSALSGGSLVNLRSGTVNLTAQNLVVGAAGTFGPTLAINTGSTINVQNTGTVTVDPGAVVLSAGKLNSAGTMTNNGEIQLTHPLAALGGTGALVNNSTITGTGRVEKNLTNNAGGSIQANGSDRLVFQGSTNNNAGLISATNGGQIEFRQPLTNAPSTGLISGQGAVIRFTGGLTNNGSMAFTTGSMDIFGDITQNVGARITISGGGTTTFYDDVTIAPGASSIQASTTGGVVTKAVFFGSYNGGVTGGGAAFIEGDHRPGNSPGLVTFGGDVFYGDVSTLHMEIGGTVRGARYDAVDVTGSVTLNGFLDVQFIAGFVPTPGVDSFLLLNNDGVDPVIGTFQDLPEGTQFNIGSTRLQISYFGGSGNDITLSAVPEPTTWALIGIASAGGCCWWYRRLNRRKLELEETITLTDMEA